MGEVTEDVVTVGEFMPHMLQRSEDRRAEVRTVFQAVDQVGFIAGAGGLSVRQNDGSGQKMEAQDAARARRGQRAKIA